MFQKLVTNIKNKYVLVVKLFYLREVRSSRDYPFDVNLGPIVVAKQLNNILLHQIMSVVLLMLLRVDNVVLCEVDMILQLK